MPKRRPNDQYTYEPIGMQSDFLIGRPLYKEYKKEISNPTLFQKKFEESYNKKVKLNKDDSVKENGLLKFKKLKQ